VVREWLSHDDIYAALHARLKGANPPTAVVTVNDTLAMAMIRRLRENGISVPEQVSIVGYDDDVIMAEGRPFLSTVRVDKKNWADRGRVDPQTCCIAGDARGQAPVTDGIHRARIRGAGALRKLESLNKIV